MNRVIECSVTINPKSDRASLVFYCDNHYDFNPLNREKIENFVDTIYDSLRSFIPNYITSSEWKDFNSSILLELEKLQNELNFALENSEEEYNKKYSIADPKSKCYVDINICLHNVDTGYISKKEQIAYNAFGVGCDENFNIESVITF